MRRVVRGHPVAGRQALGRQHGILAGNRAPFLFHKSGYAFPLDQAFQGNVFNGFGKLAFRFRHARGQNFPVAFGRDFNAMTHFRDTHAAAEAVGLVGRQRFKMAVFLSASSATPRETFR